MILMFPDGNNWLAWLVTGVCVGLWKLTQLVVGQIIDKATEQAITELITRKVAQIRRQRRKTHRRS